MSEQVTQTQTQNQEVDLIKQKVVQDIKQKLSTGELLIMLLNEIDDISEETARYIAGLLFNLNSENFSFDERDINDFVEKISKLGYNITDIEVKYNVIYYRNNSVAIHVYLAVPNGARSSTILSVDSSVYTPQLTKQQYQYYASLLETMQTFTNKLKNLLTQKAKKDNIEEE